MPLQSDAPDISVAALGDPNKASFAFHLVNNGATREVILNGLPAKVKGLRLYLTDATNAMKKGILIPVKNGAARFPLQQTSYTTLFSE